FFAKRFAGVPSVVPAEQRDGIPAGCEICWWDVHQAGARCLRRGCSMRMLLPLILLGAALVLSSGCSVQKDPDRNTGGDGTRLEAVEIPVNRTVIDNVSYIDGDQHDWKYFRVPVQGLIEV